MNALTKVGWRARQEDKRCAKILVDPKIRITVMSDRSLLAEGAADSIDNYPGADDSFLSELKAIFKGERRGIATDQQTERSVQ